MCRMKVVYLGEVTDMSAISLSHCYHITSFCLSLPAPYSIQYVRQNTGHSRGQYTGQYRTVYRYRAVYSIQCSRAVYMTAQDSIQCRRAVYRTVQYSI